MENGEQRDLFFTVKIFQITSINNSIDEDVFAAAISETLQFALVGLLCSKGFGLVVADEIVFGGGAEVGESQKRRRRFQ